VVGETCNTHGQVCGLRVVGKEGLKVWGDYSLVQNSVGWPEFLITEPNFRSSLKKSTIPRAPQDISKYIFFFIYVYFSFKRPLRCRDKYLLSCLDPTT